MAIWEFGEKEGPSADDLDGRVVPVTGGTRGIGAAISRRLPARGATVAAAYASNRERAEQFQAACARAGRTVSIHHGDVSAAEDCRDLVAEVVDRQGRLDVLLNNAGVTPDRLVPKMTEAD